MYAENLVLDDGGEGQTIKDVDKHLPRFGGQSTLTLIVEAVHLGDISRLVVTPQHEEVVWILDLVAEQ